MKQKHSKKSHEHKDIALERIIKLFELARCADEKLAKRYVEQAHTISKKYKVKIPSVLRRLCCKNCSSYFTQGKNCRVRLVNGKVDYYCFSCKHYTRIPYRKEKKAKRKL